MAHPEDRMRLKDKIIDNISKAIKSIQSHHFYKTSETHCGRSGDGFTFGNVDRPCHKLCENLDHAFLHGLKHVTHGYWPVVKQLSHKGMIRDIEILMNVTTDLGRGRAWLYASLNEGLLESYLRLLDENVKLVKKYYAKDALLMDHDRLNVLLTLITGLECVTFQLDFDQPYLDLNAAPPRGRADSELEDNVAPAPLSSAESRRVSEVSISSSSSARHSRPHSDSDSSSLASLDVHSGHGGHSTEPGADLGPFRHQQGTTMRTSVVSSDSGFAAWGGVAAGEGGDLLSPASSDCGGRSVTPTGSLGQRRRSGAAVDSVSISSLGSSGDPDRIQRVEHILPQRETVDEDPEGSSLEVIRVKSKRGSGAAKGRKKKKEKKINEEPARKDRAGTNASETSEADRDRLEKSMSRETDEKRVGDGEFSGKDFSAGLKEEKGKLSPVDSANEKVPKSQVDQVDTGAFTLPQIDSGVDIHSLLTSNNPAIEKAHDMSSESPKVKREKPKSAFAEIENKIAELCFVTEENHVTGRQSFNPMHNSDSSDVLNHDHIAETGESNRSFSNVRESEHLSSKNLAKIDARSQDNSVESGNTISTTQISSTSAHPVSASEKTTDNSNTSKKEMQKPAFDQTDSVLDSRTTSNISTSHNSHSSESIVGKVGSEAEGEDDFDFYACHDSEADQSGRAATKEVSPMSAATTQISNAHAASQLEDYMDYILQSAESPPESVSQPPPQTIEKPAMLAMSLDNNTKLQVMLDIFTKEHEKFIEMFATRENHTEGEPTPVFVLISDHCLYLLHYKNARKKFVLSCSANLVDLIFVSTGLNDQTLNIESREKSRQKQRLWLTPGHKNLTQAILACLTDAVKAANEHVVPVRSRFSVGSEVPLQKIALRKYISKELNVEAQDVTVNDYSLVFWEDPSSDTGSQNTAACKEGTLLLRTHDPNKGFVWKPVYVVLKDSMLCVSNHKTDVRPHSYLGLGGDQCVGCRLISTADRPHCVELVLSSPGAGGSWFLSAASQSEISEWRHALCLAVSQGMQEPDSLSSCVPCCAVLSCNQVFMCHEDLHTKFFRTLGRAQLEDVTGISVDPQEPSYCVIEFESQEVGVSSVQWVLYFAASLDCDRHTAAVSSAWKEIYQIDLPVLPLDNVTLQRHCRNYANLLQKQLSIS